MNHTNHLQFSTGIPGLDRMLHGLIPGDNVVLHVAEIKDYIPFIQPFYQKALVDKKKLIYFRFASHPALVPEDSGAEVYQLHPETGFERFITDTIDIIERGGRGACYIFDCLSELAVDWYSDRMLGNFFMLACPYLYKLDTIAYFALLRNHHSPFAIDAIMNTAQVYVNVYRHESDLYVHPLKVDNRFSSTMYTLNRWESDGFLPVRESAVTAAILTEAPHPWLDFTIHRPGVWAQTFAAARKALEEGEDESSGTGHTKKLYDRLLRMAVTRDEKIMTLAQKYLSLGDLVNILQRMIGTGLIGGKSLGMLLARAILTRENPDWQKALEPHDSFFIGSDVFYTYLVQNDCWWLRRRRRDTKFEAFLRSAGTARERILRGSFPLDIEHQFMEMLNYFGQAPIIVRSSSLLEDNYGNAFSGKYESVFCANQGTPANRLEAFKAAVRTVYASTMNRDALMYRANRGLLGEDEQMALLVQRVSGSSHPPYFFPQMAGVGFSFNPYVWNPDIDPRAGVLRLVFGLGTRAVDRTAEDYTRLVALNAPHRQPEQVATDARKYSQRRVDVIDLEENSLKTHSTEDTLKTVSATARNLIAAYDKELVQLARQQRREIDFPYMLNFDRLLDSTGFVDQMREILQILEKAYQNPVDVEFTANILPDNKCLIDIVQCRPLQIKLDIDGSMVAMPKTISAANLILETSGPIIGQGVATLIDRIIYIEPRVYANLPVQQRHSIARLIGKITRAADADHKKILLIAPGRLGTKSPSLGVPVSFSEINRCTALCELAVMHEGLVPDLSLGTHFFNDLVEMEILCLALFPGKAGNRLNTDLLTNARNSLSELIPDAAEWEQAVRVVEAESLTATGPVCLRADPVTQRAVCYIGTQKSHDS